MALPPPTLATGEQETLALLRSAARSQDPAAGERADGGLWAAAPKDTTSFDARILAHQPQARERAETASSARSFPPPEAALAWPLTTSSTSRAP